MKEDVSCRSLVRVAVVATVHSFALKRFFVEINEERFKMSSSFFLLPPYLSLRQFPSKTDFIKPCDMRRGHPVILVDDFDRENEGDLIVAAEKISSRPWLFSFANAAGSSVYA